MPRTDVQSEALLTYRVRVRGFWNTRHEVSLVEEGGERLQGVLSVERRWNGMIVAGRWRPEKGETLTFRRDPGLLRSQFSIWTENREWLGASLRWHPLRRPISVSTGTKPLELVPLPGLRRGWRLVAPKTGEAVRVEVPLLGRGGTIRVLQRMDFEIVLFAWFLSFQVLAESLWPGPELESDPRPASSGSGA